MSIASCHDDVGVVKAVVCLFLFSGQRFQVQIDLGGESDPQASSLLQDPTGAPS